MVVWKTEQKFKSELLATLHMSVSHDFGPSLSHKHTVQNNNKKKIYFNLSTSKTDEIGFVLTRTSESPFAKTGVFTKAVSFRVS